MPEPAVETAAPVVTETIAATEETAAIEASEETPEALPDSAVELPAIVDLDTSDARSQKPPPRCRLPRKSPSRQKLNISPTLYEIFMEEARGHLATLQAEFAVLDNDPTQPTAHQMARAAHTLAGISGTVGLGDLNQLGVALEHALLRRDITDQADNLAAIEILRQTIAALDEMIADVGMQEPPQAAPHLIAELAEIYPLPAQPVVEDIQDRERAAGGRARTDRGPRSVVGGIGGGAAPAAAPSAGTSILADLLAVRMNRRTAAPIFLEEAAELTVAITENLRAWRTNPADAEAARALHRLFHTLKGSARMAGAMTLGEITHAIESHVEHANKTGGTTADLVEEIESTFDSVVQIIERLQRGETLEAPVAAPAEADETGHFCPLRAPQGYPAGETVAAGHGRSGRGRCTDVEASEEAAAQRAPCCVSAPTRSTSWSTARRTVDRPRPHRRRNDRPQGLAARPGRKTSSVCVASCATSKSRQRRRCSRASRRARPHADAGFDPLGSSTVSRASRN